MRVRSFSLSLSALLLAVASLSAQKEGVLIPTNDYQKLLDDAKASKPVKPASPSVCHIECEIRKSERPLAVLKLTYQFRTSLPRSTVLLGSQKAFAVAASLDGGAPPALEATADGLVAVVDAAGDHTLTLTLETAIATRGAKGDSGFDISLPRAAITTLTLPNAGELTGVQIGTRGTDAKGVETKSVPVEAARLIKPYALGPTDLLEVTWTAPVAAPPATETLLETDIAVRVDETRIETTATLKLRGLKTEWELLLPAGAELSGADTTVRPADAKSPWKVSVAGEATLTVRVRQPRGAPNETKSFPIGPFLALGGVRQSGQVRIYGPPTLRLTPRPGPEVRRLDVPFVAGEDEPAAVLRYTFAANPDRKPAVLLDLDVRPAAGFIVVQPHARLTLTPQGWKLRCEYRISPVRVAVEQLSIELPGGWQPPTFSPLELVDDVQGGGDAGATRTLQVRLAAPQREPFDLVLESRWPVPAEARESSLPLPRILAARERDAQISVAVPDSLSVTGTVREWDAGKVASEATELKASKPFALGGSFDAGTARVDLAWQPFQPKLAVDHRADVTWSERQLLVTQTFKLSFSDGASRVRFTGPPTAVGFRATPAVESLGPGEWLFAPSPTSKDATLTVTYAVPLKLPDALPLTCPVPLCWPESLSATTTVRVWGNGARRIVGFTGPWRDSAPEPSADRESLPALTLQGSGSKLPLSLNVAEASVAGSVVVDRAVLQWWIGESGAVQGRARFVLKRWPVHLDVEAAGLSAVSALVETSRLEAMPGADNLVRLTLPESRPQRPTLLLELRYSAPVAAMWRSTPLPPPRLRGAVFRHPAWVQIVPPPGDLPLLLGGNLEPDQAWRWSGYGWESSAGRSSDDLDRWLNDGLASDGEPTAQAVITARQSLPEPVSLTRVPRTPMLALAVVATILTGLALLRLRSTWRNLILILLMAAFALAAVLIPQPASQVAFLLQPSLLALLIVLLARSAWRHYLLQRQLAAATFVRVTPAPMPPVIPESPSRRTHGSAVATPLP